MEYLSDDSVNDTVDRQMRVLLTTCFTKPQDVVFKTQRYFREPYPHRWVIRDAKEMLVAHVGVHEKHVLAGDKAFRIGGICEVCVHPNSRGKGYVKYILTRIHSSLCENDCDFAVLFGDPLVYGSSGYVLIDNLVHGGEDQGWKPVKAMVRELSVTAWPRGEVRLPGPTF